MPGASICDCASLRGGTQTIAKSNQIPIIEQLLDKWRADSLNIRR